MLHLSLKKVSLTLGENVDALSDVTVGFRSGELTILAGANGAGKSLLLRVAARLLTPTSGVVEVQLPDGAKGEAAFRRSLRMVVQHPSRQLLGQTVEEDLTISARIAGCDREDLRATAGRFGLQAVMDRPTHALSGGEQRRLALAGALMGEPELILFDEPFLELDYPGTQEFLRIITELHRRGIGIVLATHDYHRAAGEADRMVILRGGRVAVDAAPREAIARAEELGLRPAGSPVDQLSWLKDGGSG